MTNAEKFLKDGVSAEEFVKALFGICYNMPEEGELDYKDCFMYGSGIERWLNKQTKPTLTEDERVILENISMQYSKIGRSCDDEIYLITMIDTIHEGRYVCDIFEDDIFQFIKERRRI